MGNKKVFLCMVCALAVAMVSVAANEAFAKEDRDERPEQHRRESVDKGEQGPSHEFLEIRKRIEKLRDMARGAEEKARLLWAEAEELERNLDRGFEDRPKPEHVEEMHARLADLKEAAVHAKREGHHDEAAELHEKARRIAEEIEAQAERGGQRVPPELAQRLEELRHMAREAKERGEVEKARRFWAEAEELERNLDRGFEDRPKPEHVEEMHARLADLKEAAVHAKREGRHDEAAELHEKARRIAEEIEAQAERGGQRVPPELAQRLEELRHMAREAKERGEVEKARRFWAEAEELRHAARQAEERGEVEKARHLLSEAEQLERKVRQGFERPVRRGGPERAEKMHRKLAELKEAAEHAKREGRHDEAARLGEEAHKLAIQLEKTAHRDKITDVGREIERLHAMAAKAKEAGQHEKAEAILREAKSLERPHKDRVERPKEEPHVKELLHQIEMLREEVGRLRRDVEQLRGERPERDRPRDRDR